jgi:RNA polymerase sigma factor (sigma-70 family)
MKGRAETQQALFQADMKELFRAHHRELFKYACQLTQGHIEDAEDLLIETFVCFAQHGKAPMEEIRRNSFAYLRKTLANAFLSERRRRKALRRNVELPAGAVDLETLCIADRKDLQEQYEQQELLLQTCRHALNRMKSSNRGRVLLLRYFLGYAIQEIAQILGTTVNAIDKTLSQARTEVRQFLK